MNDGRTKALGSNLLALLIVAGTLVLTAAPAPAAGGDETFVTMISDPGDWVGGGANRYYHLGNAEVSVTGNTGELTVHVSGGNLGDDFRFEFAAAPGETLAVGEYDRAQRAPFRSATRPGIDIGGDGRGCNEITGRFHVKRIEADASGAIKSLWIFYEQHCEGGPAALIGEVRYNVPGDGGSVSVGPRALRWPRLEGQSGAGVVPITVANTSAAPATLGDASIDGSGAAHFAIRSNDCHDVTLAPGEACAVWIRLSTATAGDHEATLHIAEPPAAAHDVSLMGFVFGGRTSFRMSGGDYIGQGGDYHYTPKNAQISVGGSRRSVHAAINADDGAWWYADFEAPDGDILAAGSTYQATRYPFNNAGAGMNVSGSGRGCNELSGTFTVTDIIVNDDGLQRVGIDFEQHCEHGDPALIGRLEFRVMADEPPSPPPDGGGGGGGGDGGGSDGEKKTYARYVMFKFASRHRVTGFVTAADDYAACAGDVPVLVQRKGEGGFRTVERTLTRQDGTYSVRIGGKRGVYRTLAPRTEADENNVCLQAVASTRRLR